MLHVSNNIIFAIVNDNRSWCHQFNYLLSSVGITKPLLFTQIRTKQYTNLQTKPFDIIAIIYYIKKGIQSSKSTHKNSWSVCFLYSYQPNYPRREKSREWTEGKKSCFRSDVQLPFRSSDDGLIAFICNLKSVRIRRPSFCLLWIESLSWLGYFPARHQISCLLSTPTKRSSLTRIFADYISGSSVQSDAIRPVWYGYQPLVFKTITGMLSVAS